MDRVRVKHFQLFSVSTRHEPDTTRRYYCRILKKQRWIEDGVSITNRLKLNCMFPIRKYVRSDLSLSNINLLSWHVIIGLLSNGDRCVIHG